jgi:hypothetical protein
MDQQPSKADQLAAIQKEIRRSENKIKHIKQMLQMNDVTKTDV